MARKKARNPTHVEEFESGGVKCRISVDSSGKYCFGKWVCHGCGAQGAPGKACGLLADAVVQAKSSFLLHDCPTPPSSQDRPVDLKPDDGPSKREGSE